MRRKSIPGRGEHKCKGFEKQHRGQCGRTDKGTDNRV
jgi:hypothetical protein